MSTATTAEASLRQYWSMFNGTKKNFSEVESQFDLTFHKQFTHIFQDGRGFLPETRQSSTILIILQRVQLSQSFISR